MNAAFYLSALALGFLGSFHCAGMCGPITLMLPQSSSSPGRILAGRLIYNTGRVLTYITIGVFFGIFGLAVAMRGFQKELSIITGALILLIIILSSIYRNWLRVDSSNYFSKSIRNTLKKLFVKKTLLSLFFIGVLNGLLPCGFVYLAIAGAASSGSVTGGMLFMAFFGLGTFPVMMMISVAANMLGQKFRKIFSRFTIPVALALGVFLIYRGTIMKTSECHDRKDATHVVACPVPVSILTPTP